MNASSPTKTIPAPAEAPKPAGTALTSRLERYVTGPAGEAWALIGRTFFEHGKPRMMAINQELDLSPPQGFVLRLLDQPRPMGELAVTMHCDNSNMTGIVDRLEERGLVERGVAANDRRVKLIALTDEGERVRDELDRRMAVPPEAIANLSERDQKALRDILRRALGDA
jgi:DNA-binding MarR family transcriptional regulator